MLQRIQTIWLLMALFGLVLLFRFPAAGKDNSVLLPSYSLSNQQNVSGSLIYAVILTTTSVVIIITIFKYRNRILQMKLCRICSMLSVILVLFITIACWRYTQESFFGCYKPGLALPFASLIFQYLAYRGIKHDEDLVKSIDRIR